MRPSSFYVDASPTVGMSISGGFHFLHKYILDMLKTKLKTEGSSTLAPVFFTLI